MFGIDPSNRRVLFDPPNRRAAYSIRNRRSPSVAGAGAGREFPPSMRQTHQRDKECFAAMSTFADRFWLWRRHAKSLAYRHALCQLISLLMLGQLREVAVDVDCLGARDV